MASWRDSRPGKVPVGPIYVDEDTKVLWMQFAEARGSTVRAEIIAAMARHMETPPPLAAQVPLPAPRPRGRPRKGSVQTLENKSAD